MRLPIYLDYAATTPVHEDVFKAMQSCLLKDSNFANSGSQSHSLGMLASDAVERARFDIADAIHAADNEIIFTSGATEADNLAIRGIATAHSNQRKHIITAQTEHKAVLESCKQLEKEGFLITYLKPLCNGLIPLELIEKEITDQTLLVSIMHVNNELGVIQDIEAIGKFLKNKAVFFHVDAAQSAGKIAINLKELSVDLMSFSAHKIYGPKGIGVLYVNKNSNIVLQPQIFGGGQEQGLRAGTLPTHQIVGMGKAFSLIQNNLSKNNKHIQALNERYVDGLMTMPGAIIHGNRAHSIPHILNFRIKGIDANDLLSALPEVALSVGSACNSGANQGSHVLKAIGLSPQEIRGAMRISFGQFNSIAEIDFVIERIKTAVNFLLMKKKKLEAA